MNIENNDFEKDFSLEEDALEVAEEMTNTANEFLAVYFEKQKLGSYNDSKIDVILESENNKDFELPDIRWDNFGEEYRIGDRLYCSYEIQGFERLETQGVYSAKKGIQIYLKNEDLSYINSIDVLEGLNDLETETTVNYLGMMLHEILHEKQRELPIPIAEAAVRYYVNKILESNNIFQRWYDTDKWKPFIEQYKKFVDKYGKDAHQYIFGKKDDVKMKKELDDLFNNKFIDTNSGLVKFSYIKKES